MSLDVYLKSTQPTKEICYNCGHEHDVFETLYDANITHNLGNMADAAGIYQHLWRPEELGITTAKELIEPLTNGLRKLKDNPQEYEKYNSPNGWGMYEHFVPFVEKYLNACIQNPEAKVSISR